MLSEIATLDKIFLRNLQIQETYRDKFEYNGLFLIWVILWVNIWAIVNQHHELLAHIFLSPKKFVKFLEKLISKTTDCYYIANNS